MNRLIWLTALVSFALAASWLTAGPLTQRSALDRLNAQLAGQVIDHTHNHGADRRIWSEALHQLRDLYVYLPPHHDPAVEYPFVLYLHAFQQDERNVLDPVIRMIDQAIVAGSLPPLIVAVPDGTITGRPTWFRSGSFYINSQAGRYEDYLVEDVLPFVQEHYPVRPEREAHAVLGASMGGFGAYHLAFDHPELFKQVVGIFPPLNTRWSDCDGRYRVPFSPDRIGFRTSGRPHEVVARFYGIPVYFSRLVDPLYGRGPGAIDAMAQDNPTEMLDRLDIRPGGQDYYIGYGGRDQFNVMAQVESFLWFAERRGIHVDTEYLPEGRHDEATGVKLFPGVAAWLGPRLAGQGQRVP